MDNLSTTGDWVKKMDNFSGSEFVLELCVLYQKEQNKKIEKCNEYYQEYQREIKNPQEKKEKVWLGAKIITWSKEETKVKATFN